MAAQNPWLMRIESGLAAHFAQESAPSRPSVMWSVGLKRGEETWTVTVKALLSDTASAATRADRQSQARTAIQYLKDRLEQGWHPGEQLEHTIYIGDPLGAPAPTKRKPWWKIL